MDNALISLEKISNSLMLRLFCLFIFCISFACASPVREKHGFDIANLSTEQVQALDLFFRALVRDSFAGYVLYGDKPICIEGYPNPLDSGAISGINTRASLLAKGISIWNNFEINNRNKEYFLTIFDVEYGYRHLVFINKKAFLKTVNQHLPLFRYILGPTLTAENLLQKLIESKQDFYKVLKKNNVLLGILLGYGVENALIVSREEYLADAFPAQRKEIFPFLPKKITKKSPILNSELPSLGFKTLEEELNKMKSEIVVSRNLKPFDVSPIPYFGCKPNSEESRILLGVYEKNRMEILKAIEQKDFLKSILSKLLNENDRSIQPKPNLNKNYGKKELAKILATIIRYEFKEEGWDFQFLSDFLDGVRKREKDPQKTPNSRETFIENYQIENELEKAKNLEESDWYFDNLNKKHDEIIPGRLYFEEIQAGSDDPISKNVKTVSFHFSYNLIGTKHTEAGTVNSAQLQKIIPGVAMGLMGMKKGGQRLIYIHPEYGYGEDSYFPPNTSILAKIELIDFEKSNDEATIALPHKIKTRNVKAIKTEWQNQLKKICSRNGEEFWDFFKSHNVSIDYKEFESAIKDDKLKKPSNYESFLTDLFFSITRSNSDFISK